MFRVPSGERSVRLALVVGFLLVLALLAGRSQHLRSGDPDYMALALSLSKFGTPTLSTKQIAYTEQRFQEIGSGYEGFPLVPAAVLPGKDGRWEFAHFWFYSALAVPWLWIARVLGLRATLAFAFLNTALLLTALWIVSGKLNPFAALLLFCGPILWWIDKAQTEIFTFSLLAIAFALLPERPWWSMICLGAAATQNPPIALVIPLVGLATLVQRKAALRDARLWLGGAAACALAVLNPVYFQLRLGTVLPLASAGGVEMHWPTLGEYEAVLGDPNVGLLTNFPLFAPVLLVAVVALFLRHRAQFRFTPIWVATASALVFLFSFCQTRNLNAGGTPSMSRYALWLIPLAVPLLRQADVALGVAARRWMAPVALISCTLSILQFQPNRPVDYLRPTPLANLLWTRYPSLDNPRPEIFVERLQHQDSGFWDAYNTGGCRAALASLSVATANCSKVLLVGGESPPLCPLGTAPPSECAKPGALCYANRGATGYQFVKAPVDPIERFVNELFSSPERSAGCGP